MRRIVIFIYVALVSVILVTHDRDQVSPADARTIDEILYEEYCLEDYDDVYQWIIDGVSLCKS